MDKIVLNKLKKTIISIMVFLLLITLLFALTSCKSSNQETTEAANDIIATTSTTETTVDTGTSTTSQTTTSENESTTETTGTVTETTEPTESTSQTTLPQAQQIIEVIAKTGGYSPRKIEAKAGVPTTLVMISEGAYGCERAFNIFDPNTKTVLASQTLPENGQTEFDLGILAEGSQLVGVCSMGMYYFQILFN